MTLYPTVVYACLQLYMSSMRQGIFAKDLVWSEWYRLPRDQLAKFQTCYRSHFEPMFLCGLDWIETPQIQY